MYLYKVTSPDGFKEECSNLVQARLVKSADLNRVIRDHMGNVLQDWDVNPLVRELSLHINHAIVPSHQLQLDLAEELINTFLRLGWTPPDALLQETPAPEKNTKEYKPGPCPLFLPTSAAADKKTL
jgi:hypothetical protein